LRCKKTLRIAIAQAVPDWCFAKNVQFTTRARLGLMLFPVDFDRNFFEQLERSSKLSVAKKIIEKGSFSKERPCPQRL